MIAPVKTPNFAACSGERATPRVQAKVIEPPRRITLTQSKNFQPISGSKIASQRRQQQRGRSQLQARLEAGPSALIGGLFEVSGVATVVSVSAANEMDKPPYSNPPQMSILFERCQVDPDNIASQPIGSFSKATQRARGKQTSSPASSSPLSILPHRPKTHRASISTFAALRRRMRPQRSRVSSAVALCTDSPAF